METMYSIYDSRAKVWFPPFKAENDETAARLLSTPLEDETHNFYRYTEDFALYGLGMWDEETGELSSEPTYLVCKFVDLAETVERAMKKKIQDAKIDPAKPLTPAMKPEHIAALERKFSNGS